MGAALFIKQVASKSNDLELLGLAAWIEMALTERFQGKSSKQKAWEEQQQAEIKFHEQVREICILHFFKEPKFKVDLSRYRG
ncbi:MAG: hypothetical protein ACREA0_32270 [bacterium]